jgi:hypothetical protein
MIFSGHSQFAGRFRLRVYRNDGTLRRDTGWFNNLITNNGLDYPVLGPTQAFGARFMFPQCFVGTGSATPSFTDTSLQAYLASSNAAGPAVPAAAFVAGPPPYWQQFSSYRFSTGTAAGNISEIAIGASPTNIFNRALILDNLGNPTTITVLADELLDVTYEFRVYPPTTDEVATFAINGVSQSITTRSFGHHTAYAVPEIMSGIKLDSAYTTATSFVKATNTALVPLTGYPTFAGGSVHENTTTFAPYTVGSCQRDFTCSYSLTEMNGSHYMLYIDWVYGHRQFLLSSPLTKTNVQYLSITGRFTWGRYP